ncbi:MAG TPA: mechanosensitive ion channel domain-containing protein [Burkholderiales bacterium]|nr:mechanosensitive ion channel domain-containing protein [Burkholderiales bacterium]
MTSNDITLSFKLCALLLLAVVTGATPGKLTAQDNENVEVQKSEQPDTSLRQKDKSPMTETERVNRLREVIKLDQEKLVETRQNFAELEQFFDKLNVYIDKAETELTDTVAQLQALGGDEALDGNEVSKEAAALKEEIQRLEQVIVVAKTELELKFNSGKNMQSQIQALEQKIENDQQALETLLNPTLAQPAAPPQSPPAASPAAPTGPSAVQMMVPGAAIATGQTTPDSQPSAAQPETAEQIEARREAEKLEAEARVAEQELVSFVERKRALDAQIEIEQSLLDTAKQSRKNLDLAADGARANLQRLIDNEASKAELRESESSIDNIQKLQRRNREEIDQRRAYLDSLYKRRENLNDEQLAVTQETEEKRQEAAKARDRSVWLESPLHPRNVGHWFVVRGPRILMVIVLGWALLALVRISSQRIARTLVGKVGGARRGSNRADTLALSFQSALSLLIMVSAVLLAFQEAGVDIKTVLGGAAILGVAFAFGAQNLMRDYFTGFMIVLEDQYELGDLITIGAITGTVEKLNMRTTVLRDLEGRVHFIPNGEIKSVTNRTYVWGRALLEIPVGFKEDPDRVMAVIQAVEEEFRADPEFSSWVTGDPVMLGVDKFSEYGMIIKTFVQTQPDKIFATKRELLRRIKKRFDEEGIEISVPHRTLLQPGEA